MALRRLQAIIKGKLVTAERDIVAQARALLADDSQWPPEPEPTIPTAPAATLTLTHLSAILDAPDCPIDYVWQGRLVAGTASILVSKPKVGKSTLARNLCLSVARGDPFMGWPCKRGAVVYVGLEERAQDIGRDFRGLGAKSTDEIYVCDDGRASIVSVCELIRDKRPILCVIDPLQRLTHVKDGQSYAENYNALGPLIDAAKESGTHLMFLHHSSKIAKGDAVDAPLGSTALAGVVASVLVMRRTESFRTLESIQRLGPDFPETLLVFDEGSKRLALGGSREAFELNRLGIKIMAVLGDAPMTEPELLDGIETAMNLKRKELRKLVAEKKIQRTGTGKKGDGFLYGKMLDCSTSAGEKISVEHFQEEVVQDGVAQGKKDSRLNILDTPQSSNRAFSDPPETHDKRGKMLDSTLLEKVEHFESSSRAFSASETGATLEGEI